jgi:hypothetical protein
MILRLKHGRACRETDVERVDLEVVVMDWTCGLVVTIGHDRTRPAGFTHRKSPRKNWELNKMWHKPFLRSLGEFGRWLYAWM